MRKMSALKKNGWLVVFVFLFECGCANFEKDINSVVQYGDYKSFVENMPDLGVPEFPKSLPYPVGLQRVAYLIGFTEGWCIVQEGNQRMIVVPLADLEYQEAWTKGALQGKKLALEKLDAEMQSREDKALR